jgi:hypothetical protein
MAKITMERTWLESTTPSSLLRTLKGKRMPRQRRLIAVAACRRFLDEMADPASRHAIKVAERFADGKASEEERQRAFESAQAVALSRLPKDQDKVAWNVWRLAYAAQLTCAPSQAEEAVAVLLKGAIRQGKEAASREKVALSELIRDIIGNPFRPMLAPPRTVLDWNDRAVLKLAEAIYDERHFGDLPVLADALEEAGSDQADLLLHLRSGGTHALGCWAVDLILGRR